MWITWTSMDWPYHIGRVNTYYRLLLVSQERFGIVYISTPSACYPWHWAPHSSAGRQKRATCRFLEFYSRIIRLTQHCRQLNVQQEPHNGDREVHECTFRSLVNTILRSTQRISRTAAEGLTRNTDFFEQVDLSHKHQVEWKPSHVS